MTLQSRVEQWRAGQQIAAEEYTLQERLYFKNGLLQLLVQVGFGEVPVHGDYTEAAATAEHGVLICIARK